ncbi:MAG: D-aminoacyl-tRNA deacylase [Paracoccaceae bacterium]
MRAVLQRVTRAQVVVDGQVVGRCAAGLMILICAMQGDDATTAAKMAAKVAKMRIFKDDQGKMNLSVRDIAGSALVISQFTLAADLRGNRPGFSTAATPDLGNTLYQAFAAALTAEGVPVETGIFGADMAVDLVNDGPVTIWIDSAG